VDPREGSIVESPISPSSEDFERRDLRLQAFKNIREPVVVYED
jgi:hypothetical protein